MTKEPSIFPSNRCFC